MGYLFAWIGASKLFIYLSFRSVHVSCMYQRRNKIEAGAGSGPNKVRKRFRTLIYVNSERETVGDATYNYTTCLVGCI